MSRRYNFFIFCLFLFILIGIFIWSRYLSYFIIDRELQPLITNVGWKLNERSRIYEFNGKPPLWLYWDNKVNQSKMPPHICLALKSLHCHNHEHLTIRILNSKVIHSYISDIHPIFPYLTLNHRADYIRGRILEKYGGMYMDIDAIALQSVVQWFDLLINDGYDIVGYSWLSDGDKIGVGTLGPVHANHSLFRRYTETVHQKMDEKINLTIQNKADLFQWGEIMRIIIVPIFHELLKQNATKSMMYDGPSTIGQITARGLRLLSNDENCNILQKLNLNVPFLIYYNSAFRFLKETDEELLESKTSLGCFYRRALQNCSIRANGSMTKAVPSCEELQFLYTTSKI